jgi:hypothetical protein
MSYKNPKIIDDKSALIVPQAMAKATGDIAKGIGAYGVKKAKEDALRKKEAEKKAKEDAADRNFLIKLNNEAATSSLNFDKNIDDLAEGVQSVLSEKFRGTLTRINEIKVAQRNGDASGKLSKELASLQHSMLEDNGLAESMMAVTGDLPELMKRFEEINKTVYYTDDENGSNGRSKSIIMAFGGAEGYKASMVEEDGVLYAVAEGPEGAYKMRADEFKNIIKDLTLEMPDIPKAQNDFNMEVAKNVAMEPGGTQFVSTENRVNQADGKTYKHQLNNIVLDPSSAAQAQSDSVNFVISNIDSFKTSTQAYKNALTKIGIVDYEGFANSTEAEQKTAIKNQAIKSFESTTGIKEKIKTTKNQKGEDVPVLDNGNEVMQWVMEKENTKATEVKPASESSKYDITTFDSLPDNVADFTVKNLGVSENSSFYKGDKEKTIDSIAIITEGADYKNHSSGIKNAKIVKVQYSGDTAPAGTTGAAALTTVPVFKFYNLSTYQGFSDFYNNTKMARSSSVSQRANAIKAAWNRMKPKK